jgi:hypothetical protein
MSMMTSRGLTEPRAARPSVRISIMLITTVIKTTSTAPKLRESSRRMEEWNNIDSNYLSLPLCGIRCLTSPDNGIQFRMHP